MPKVSVIIPIYNVEKYLERCLDSVLNQTYSDIEIICVNDCSPDGSQKIVDQYVNRYPDKVYSYSNPKNMGLGRTRNYGVSVAQGEYILFIDSDDYIREDYVQTYLNEMQEAEYDIVVGGYVRDEDGRLTEHKVADSQWSILTYTIACAKMYRREFLLQNQLHFSAVKFAEDVYFSLCVFSCSPRYKVMDYAGYYYYYNRKSLTGSMNYDRKSEELISGIFEDYLGKHDVNDLTQSQQRMVEYMYLSNMIHALITFGHGCKPVKMREKYQFFMRDLRKKFPDYKKNPYVGFRKSKGQSMKIRIGVGVTMGLHKIHLDALMFYVISLI